MIADIAIRSCGFTGVSPSMPLSAAPRFYYFITILLLLLFYYYYYFIIITILLQYYYYFITVRPIPLLTLDFRRFDSSIMLYLRGEIPRPIGDLPECLSQAMLLEIILVGRLGVVHCEYTALAKSPCPLSSLILYPLSSILYPPSPILCYPLSSIPQSLYPLSSIPPKHKHKQTQQSTHIISPVPYPPSPIPYPLFLYPIRILCPLSSKAYPLFLYSSIQFLYILYSSIPLFLYSSKDRLSPIPLFHPHPLSPILQCMTKHNQLNE